MPTKLGLWLSIKIPKQKQKGWLINYYERTTAHIAMPANNGCKRPISISFHVFLSKNGNPVSEEESSPRMNLSTAGPGESNRAMNLLSNCYSSPLLQKIGKWTVGLSSWYFLIRISMSYELVTFILSSVICTIGQHVLSAILIKSTRSPSRMLLDEL